MTQKYFVDADGNYLGSYDGAEPPEGSVEVPGYPEYGSQKWDFDAGNFRDLPAVIPDSVTARQFKLQLVASNLYDQVGAWIAQQDQATQVAYEYSGTFVRNEPMMQTGFATMGFTTEQVDAFFLAASQL